MKRSSIKKHKYFSSGGLYGDLGSRNIYDVRPRQFQVELKLSLVRTGVIIRGHGGRGARKFLEGIDNKPNRG